MLPLIRHLIQTIQPLLTPICFFMAWGFIILLGWTFWSSIRDTTARAKQMHKIPCTGCQFFTNDYHLKCTVQPTIASTENAIDCSDYRSI